MKNKILLGLTVASLAGFASSFALANPTSISLGNGAGTTNGGEFDAKLISGTVTPFQAASVLAGTASGTSFVTFCLEKNEYFNSYSQTLYVKGAPNTDAIYGGVGAAAMYSGDVAGTTSVNDPISFKTAYLYTKFSAGTLSNYNYSDAGRVADANDLQNAFWYLENELGAETANNSLFNSLSTQTKAWITEATNANWTSIGNVRVLNLYTGTDFTYAQRSQDQLYMTAPVPEPETYAMMLAGLGLIGFLAKRRRRKLM